MGLRHRHQSLDAMLATSRFLTAVPRVGSLRLAPRCSTRSANDESVIYTARRHDRLLPACDGFRLQDRYVVLDSVVLVSSNLSILF